jgi:hypothetical protein
MKRDQAELSLIQLQSQVAQSARKREEIARKENLRVAQAAAAAEAKIAEVNKLAAASLSCCFFTPIPYAHTAHLLLTMLIGLVRFFSC